MNPCWPVAVALSLAAAGCAVRRGPETVESFSLLPEQHAFSRALAHYAHGLALLGTDDDSGMAGLALEQAVLLDPDSLLARQALTAHLLQEGKAGDALSGLRDFVRKHPDNVAALRNLAVVLESEEHFAEAGQVYSRLEELDESQALPMMLARVRCLFAANEDDQALELLTDWPGWESNSSRQAALLYWARHFAGRKDFSRADFCMERAVAVSRSASERADLLLLRGDVNMLWGKPAVAAGFFRQALASDPSRPLPALKYAAAVGEDELMAAVDELKDDFSHSPGELYLKSLIGALYYAAGQPDAAADWFYRLYGAMRGEVAMDKDFFVFVGGLLIESGRKPAAVSLLREGRQKFPDHSLILNNLAYTLAELDQDIDEAYRYARRALELEPDHPAYLDTMGWVYFRKAEFASALPYLKASLEQLPDDPVVLDHVGDTLAALSRIEEALDYWRESYRHKQDQAVGEKLQRHGVDLEKIAPADESVTADNS